MSLTEKQREHLEEIKRRFAERVEIKYEKGQYEHGGDLFRKPNLPLLLEEVVDLVVYAYTLEDQIKEAIVLLESSDEDNEVAQAAKNILVHGNKGGGGESVVQR